MNFLFSILMAIGMIICFFVIYGIEDILNITNVFFFSIFLICNLVHVYIYKLQEVEVYNTIKAAEKRDSKQEFLVSQLLPKHVT